MFSLIYFELLPYTFDIKKLQTEVTHILNTVPLPDDNQLGLVHRYGQEEKCWTDGCGSPFKFDNNRIPIRDGAGQLIRAFNEADFKYVNTALKGTEIAKIYTTLGQYFNVSRYRMTVIPPKRCYGWHVDEEVRLHIPIFTNPGSFLITDDGIASHLPADGKCYLFRANNSYHTAINSDYSANRVHLLINVI